MKSRRLRDIQLKVVKAALEIHEGNKSAAARFLGIHRPALYSSLRQVKKHNISSDKFLRAYLLSS
jgi:DNA-binding NtrC family response regulator